MAFTKKAKTFGRPRKQRMALMRSLARSLVIHERISTTEAKAKALRPFVERLVTYAKKDTLASRRLTQARLGDVDATKKLFAVIGPRYKERAGGYTRVVKRSHRGSNDARKLAYIAFVQ
jgi:large subunit ribosomal protein L17